MTSKDGRDSRIKSSEGVGLEGSADDGDSSEDSGSVSSTNTVAHNCP